MKPAINLGVAIAADRERLGISQEQIAAAMKITQQAVSGWESGESMPRGKRLMLLADYFGPDSQTANVIEHIYPKSYKTQMRNALQLSAEEHNAFHRGHRGMGTQTGAGEKKPPPEDTSEPRAHEAPASYIQSFEARPQQPIAGDVQDALTRAQHGVQLARQVLDDAANQLARALAQIPKQ